MGAKRKRRGARAGTGHNHSATPETLRGTSRPTRTTNRLHLTDLSHERFEAMCMAIVFQLRPWADLRHYGSSGSDGGVDIFSRERQADGRLRAWAIQCRRYKQATASTVRRAVDDLLRVAHTPPDVGVVVLACNVTRAAHEAFFEHATQRGIGEPALWTQSYLEALLYSERRDLLFAFFGISTAEEAREREATVRQSIAMKRRVMRELGAENVDRKALLREPAARFRDSEVIIRSVEDTTYPTPEERPGISSWFKLEPFDHYHNGVEFVLGIEPGLLSGDGHWALTTDGLRLDDRFKPVNLFWIGRIPYRNIVEIDTMGDEFGWLPHIYCRFAEGGTPYEEFVYRLATGGEYPSRMDPALRVVSRPSPRRRN